MKELFPLKTYFVSGIDTDAGKTVATGFISRTLREEGVNVITQKLIQTGNHGISEDIAMHRQIESSTTTRGYRWDDLLPYLLLPLFSPHGDRH